MKFIIGIVLFLIFCIIDTVCYSKAKFPERMQYSLIPPGGIIAFIKLRKKK